MLATRKSYVIEKERDKESDLRFNEDEMVSGSSFGRENSKASLSVWEKADREAANQMNENTRRILERFLDGGSVPLDFEEKTATDEYDDSMPSQETLKYASVKVREMEKDQAKGLSTKSKIMIAVYIGVVLTLVLMIALTSISMSASVSGYAALVDSHGEVLEEISGLQAQIEEIQNGFDVDEIASQLGFGAPSQENISYYTSPKTRAPQQYTVENNWFDALCDLLSGLF